MVRYFLVDLAHKAVIQYLTVQLYLEHFQLGHGSAGSKVGGGGCDFIAPVDCFYLVYEHLFQCWGYGEVVIEFLFRNSFVEFRCFW